MSIKYKIKFFLSGNGVFKLQLFKFNMGTLREQFGLSVIWLLLKYLKNANHSCDKCVSFLEALFNQVPYLGDYLVLQSSKICTYKPTIFLFVSTPPCILLS